jgi:hypothetical protein
MVFVKHELKDRISRISRDKIKLGVLNTLGNKGCVSVKFFIDDTNLCFMNCHLQAG